MGMVFMLREYIYEMFLSNSEPHRCSSFELMWTPPPEKKNPRGVQVHLYRLSRCTDTDRMYIYIVHVLLYRAA